MAREGESGWVLKSAGVLSFKMLITTHSTILIPVAMQSKA
jgi:hypothetical protein